MYPRVIIAQVDIYKVGVNQGQEWVAGVFDEFWTKVVLGDPYIIIANIAALIAVFAIAIWTLNVIDRRQDGDRGPIDLTYLARFALIIALLAHTPNQSPLSATMTVQLHKASNGIVKEYNTGVRRSLQCPSGNKSCDLSQSLNNMAAARTHAVAVIADAIRGCPAQPAKEAQNECFLAAQKQMHSILDPYINRFVDNWATKLGRYLDEQIAKAMKGDYGTYKWGQRVLGGTLGSLSGLSQYGIAVFLMAFGTAIQFATELASILVSLMGPFVLALSLADLEKVSPLKLWFSGFVGLVTIKLSFGIIVTLTAHASLAAGNDNNLLLFPLLMGVIGPILSLALGTCNGVIVFSALSRVASSGAAYFITPKR